MANTLLSQLDSIAAQKNAADLRQKIAEAQQKLRVGMAGNITAPQITKDDWIRAMGVSPTALMQCELERIENGYLIRISTVVGALVRVYYAPDLKAVGEQITAIAVTRELGGDDVKQT